MPLRRVVSPPRGSADVTSGRRQALIDRIIRRWGTRELSSRTCASGRSPWQDNGSIDGVMRNSEGPTRCSCGTSAKRSRPTAQASSPSSRSASGTHRRTRFTALRSGFSSSHSACFSRMTVDSRTLTVTPWSLLRANAQRQDQLASADEDGERRLRTLSGLSRWP